MKRARSKRYQIRVTDNEWLRIEYQSFEEGISSSEVFRRWISTLPDPPNNWKPIED